MVRFAAKLNPTAIIKLQRFFLPSNGYFDLKKKSINTSKIIPFDDNFSLSISNFHSTPIFFFFVTLLSDSLYDTFIF